MEQEDKQLLFKDLCARLPYGVKVHSDGIPHEQILIGFVPDIEHYNIKPYLRSLSSMTEEERKIYIEISSHLCGEIAAKTMIDWLNANHFNYRLPPHLFIEAPEGMYKK